MDLRVEGERGEERVWCPKCGREITGDLHSDLFRYRNAFSIEARMDIESEEKERYLAMDNWICTNMKGHDDGDIVVIDRDEVEKKSYPLLTETHR